MKSVFPVSRRVYFTEHKRSIWNPNHRLSSWRTTKKFYPTYFSYGHQTCKETAKVAPFVMRHQWKRAAVKIGFK